MIKKNLFRLFFLFCSVVILIHLFEQIPSHIFSLDTLIQLGLLMISLELMIHLKIKSSNETPDQITLNSKTSDRSVEYQHHPFLWSKIGLSTVSLAYLTQILMI